MPFLIPLGVGLILGIILTTKILEKAMNSYPQPTYLIILGFVLGSMGEVFSGHTDRYRDTCMRVYAAGGIRLHNAAVIQRSKESIKRGMRSESQGVN